MFQKTKVCKGLMLAFGGSLALSALPALAQQTQDQQPQQLQRVEITGSAIKRIDAETAVPVTVIKMDDLKKTGVTSVEQVLSQLAASQTSQTTSQAVGLASGGASFASLRGLGQNKTLVLLDGRRIANNSFDGSAPDLNMIPFAAIERIEVLRDGASALYGTDAVGGVINFITRRSFQGGSITVGYDTPTGPGGQILSLNGGYGFGDLDKDRYNVLAIIDYQKQDKISASQRSFASTGYLPQRGIFKSSSTPFPANYSQGANSSNPALPTCDSNPYIFPAANGKSCRYNYVRWVDLIPETQRASAMLKTAFKISDDTQLNLSYFIADSTTQTTIAPVPFGALRMNPGTPYFPGNGITPAPTNFTINPALPIRVRFRDVLNGPRQDSNHNTQHRLLASIEGTAAGWDYNAGISYNLNKVVQTLTGGYADGGIIGPGVQNGIINPFSTVQTPAAQALVNSAFTPGDLLHGKGETWTVDARGSRELGDWLNAGRPAAIAVGAEFRREKFRFAAFPDYAAKVVASTGVDPATNSGGSRNVEAAYTELNVPITKALEVTAALRVDHYSDFGSTTNPKVGFRFQPVQEFLLRGSYSTGFRAPSLYEQYAPITYTNTPNSWNDPLLCPNGTPVAGYNALDVCGNQFESRQGTLKRLLPEKSKNFTLGLVFEPMSNLNLGVDLWWIKLRNQITFVPDTLIFGDPVKYAKRFVRNQAGLISSDGSECPSPVTCGYIDQPNENLGDINTNGIDLSANYRYNAGDLGSFTLGYNGTYVHKYEYQQDIGGVFNQNVGIYSGTGPIFKWQHSLSLGWSRGEWGLGLVNHYKSGYTDQNDPNQIDPQFFDRVASYTVWDMYGTWKPNKKLSLTAGLRNMFDRNPPFSNQGATFQVGYDPRFTDPTGRTVYVRGNYSF